MNKASVQDLKGTCSLRGLLTGDVKATFNQAALDIGMLTNDNFNKVLAEIFKDTFPAYAFCE